VRIYLGPYEGEHPDNLNLNEPPTIQVQGNTLQVRAFDWQRRQRQIAFTVVITGDHDTITDKVVALERFARWAQQWFEPAAHHAPLVFSVEVQGRWVYWDVREATVTYEDWHPGIGVVRCRVELVVAPWARGQRQVVLSATSVGAVAELSVPGVPGEAPGLAIVRFTDTSTSGVVTGRLRIGRTSPGMQGTLVIDASAASGASTISDTTALGGSFARRSLANAWTAVALVTPGNPAPRGMFDVWVRARDQSGALPAPDGLVANPAPTGMVRQFATGNFTANQALTVNLENLPLIGSTLIAVFRCTGASGPEPGGIAGWTLAHSDTTSSGHLYIYFCQVTPQTQRRSWTFSLSNMSLTGNVTLIEVTSLLSSPVGVRQQYTQTGTTGSTPSPTQSQRQLHEFYLSTMFLASGNATMYLNSNGPFQLVTYNQPSTTGMIRIDVLTKTASQASVNNNYWWQTTTSATYNFAINQVQFLASPPSIAGTIPPQTMMFSVVARNASAASAPSRLVAVTLETGGAVQLSWQPVSGATTYDLYYWSGRTATWRVVNVTTTNYVLTSDTVGTEVGQTFAQGGTEVRGVAVVGQQDLVAGPSALVVGGGWRWLHLGTFPLPPHERGVDTAMSWQLRIEGRSPAGATLDIDCVALLDHLGAQVDAYAVSAPPTGAMWVLEPTTHERTMGVLRNGSNIVGAAQVSGLLTLEPGENKLVVLLETNSGDVPGFNNPNGQLEIEVIPRYSLHRGA
jgi:hypothetical protein